MSDTASTRHLKVTRPTAIGPCRIEIDGRDYADGMTRLDVSLGSPAQPTIATVDLAVLNYEYDGQAKFFVAEPARQLLLEFGWTPPADEVAS